MLRLLLLECQIRCTTCCSPRETQLKLSSQERTKLSVPPGKSFAVGDMQPTASTSHDHQGDSSSGLECGHVSEPSETLESEGSESANLSEVDYESEDQHSSAHEEIDENNNAPTASRPTFDVGTYVLCQFPLKKSTMYYVRLISPSTDLDEEVEMNEVAVDFLRKSTKRCATKGDVKFLWPDVKDKIAVEKKCSKGNQICH